MTDSAVKIYGFVNDTAFFNREFSDASGVGKVDQGAACITDKVLNMFGTPKLLPDPRSERVPTPELMTLGESYAAITTPLKTKLQMGNTHLLGKMSIMIDEAKLPIDEKDDIITRLTEDTEKAKALWSFIELVGNHQVFNSDNDREKIDVNRAEVVAAAAKYVEKCGAEVDITQMGVCDFFIKNDANIYHTATEDPSFHIMRFVRKMAVINVSFKDSKDADLPLELHLWWDEANFLETYPLSTITDVVLPCEAQYLYEVLDNFKSVNAFIEHSSSYYRTRMDAIMKVDDHTGVAHFTTNYYAYPDTQPSNSFPMTFGCVYKGHEPSLDEIKDRMRLEILSILPTHSEEEWRKKLPGLIADRIFFLIPIYDNVWWSSTDHSDYTKAHRKGIFDLTRHANVITKLLNPEYTEKMLQYVQLIAPIHSKYPVLCVPQKDNPSTARLVSELYPDFMGLGTGEEDETGGRECDITRTFTEGLNATLGKAARNEDSGTISDFDGNWCHFSPLDGSTYYILTKNSYLAKI